MAFEASYLRTVVRSVLGDRGFIVRNKPGQGYLPNSRLVAVKDGKKSEIAVKASKERALGFTKRSKNRWRTLSDVDYVVAVVPANDPHAGIEIFAFKAATLEKAFDEAWRDLHTARLAVSYEIPVFIPLDQRWRKNVGHGVANLKNLASCGVCLTAQEASARIRTGGNDSYVEEFRVRFAKENAVDVEQVLVGIIGRRK